MTSPSPIYLGPNKLSAVNYWSSATDFDTITAIYWGTTQVWSAGLIGEIFTGLGTLENWIIDALGPSYSGTLVDNQDIPAVFNNLNQLVTGSGTLLGTLAAFVANPSAFDPANTLTSSSPLGAIIAQIPTDIEGLETGVCAQLASLSADITNVFNSISTAITGIVNGTGVVGGNILETDWNLIMDSSNPLLEFENLVGITAVNQDLAALLGVVTDDTTGVLGKSTNFLTDLTGAVIGLVTCGQYQSSPPADIVYPIGVVSANTAKMFMPSGLVSLPTQTSYSRYPTTSAADNGYVETQVTSLGQPGYISQVFRRWDNSGNGAAGVGMDFRSSVASIVCRVGSANTLVAPQICGYSPGDVFRLTQVGDVHTVTKNGLPVGSWTDSGGVAEVGSGYRSIAMSMQCAQELLGPSNYSPTLSYVLGN
jgi:hypothetical protein